MRLVSDRQALRECQNTERQPGNQEGGKRRVTGSERQIQVMDRSNSEWLLVLYGGRGRAANVMCEGRDPATKNPAATTDERGGRELP